MSQFGSAQQLENNPCEERAEVAHLLRAQGVGGKSKAPLSMFANRTSPSGGDRHRAEQGMVGPSHLLVDLERALDGGSFTNCWYGDDTARWHRFLATRAPSHFG